MKRGIGFLLEGYMFNNKDKIVEHDVNKANNFYATQIICNCNNKHEDKTYVPCIKKYGFNQIKLERYSVMIDNNKHIGYIGICDECGKIHYSLKEE